MRLPNWRKLTTLALSLVFKNNKLPPDLAGVVVDSVFKPKHSPSPTPVPNDEDRS